MRVPLIDNCLAPVGGAVKSSVGLRPPISGNPTKMILTNGSPKRTFGKTPWYALGMMTANINAVPWGNPYEMGS